MAGRATIQQRFSAIAWLPAMLLFAGCAGAGTAGQEKSPAIAPSATVSSQTGGIDGIVVTDEQQPIPGANASLRREGGEFQSSVITADDGTYSFSKLDPGSYVLSTVASGFEAHTMKVSIVAGEVTPVNTVLVRMVPPSPVPEMSLKKGFINFAFSFVLGGNTYTSSLGQGLPNEKSHFPVTIDLKKPFQEVVLELVWQPGSAGTGTRLQLVMCTPPPVKDHQHNCYAVPDSPAWTSPRREGASPLVHRIKQLPLERFNEFIVAVGDGGTTPAPITVQQNFDLYLTVCYYAQCGTEYQARPPS